MTLKIYHYTNAQAIYSILAKKENSVGSLWATSSLFMNDPQELLFCKNFIVNRIDEYEMNNLKYKEALVALKNWVVNQWEAHHQFILSFSLNPDSLSLWNRYGNNDGYNIEFDHEKLLSLIKSNKNLFFFGSGQVLYNPKEQIRIIDDLINKYSIAYSTNQFKPIDNETMANIKFEIWPYLFFLKNSSFHDESEFRYVFHLMKSKKNIQSTHFQENSKFRVRNGVIVPYIEIPLDENLSCINKIHIGPLNNTDNVVNGLKLIIEKYNYNIEVDTSKIPYRSV